MPLTEQAYTSRQIGRVSEVTTVTIALNGTTSTAFDMRGYAGGKIIPSATLEGTSLTFTECVTPTGTFVAVNDGAGNAVTKTIAASKSIPLPAELYGSRFVKLVSNAGGGENALETITICLIG